MRPSPRISVVVPTRERSGVLRSTLATIAAQTYENLEILVSDNCSTDGTRDVALGLQDSRLKYVNTGRRVSMSENWEFALGHATGEWITILGDDDGLLPGALEEIARLIRETNCKAIRSQRCAYSWPSPPHPYGRLRVPTDHGHEIRDSRTWLEMLVRGDARYLDLPMLYEGGFVHASVLDAMKRTTGRIYHSCIPDIYSAVAIASVVPRYVYSHAPFAIAGASVHSTGTSHWAGPTTCKTAPASMFRAEPNLPFHPAIPHNEDGNYPRSMQAFVYESFLQSQFLRETRIEVSPGQQLELVLATAGEHADSVVQWGKLFANLHGLPFEAIRARSRRVKHRLQLAELPRRVRDAMSVHVIGTPAHPIADVHQASVMVASIRSSLPSRVTRLRAAAERLLGRV